LKETIRNPSLCLLTAIGRNTRCIYSAAYIVPVEGYNDIAYANNMHALTLDTRRSRPWWNNLCCCFEETCKVHVSDVQNWRQQQQQPTSRQILSADIWHAYCKSDLLFTDIIVRGEQILGANSHGRLILFGDAEFWKVSVWNLGDVILLGSKILIWLLYFWKICRSLIYFAYVYSCVHTYIYIYTHKHTYVHTHKYLRPHTHTHTYIYIYVYTYMHTHIYTHSYVHTYTHKEVACKQIRAYNKAQESV